MRRVLISLAKCLAFLGIWTALTAIVVLGAVAIGGEGFYAIRHLRVGVEIALCAATLVPLLVMALVVDGRGAASLGFGAKRLPDLLWGALLGAAILAAPIGVLLGLGAARYEPDVAGFSGVALALGLLVCFFNVVTQEALVRSYVFQELWAKYGPVVASIVTTLIFVALHAAPITQSGVQGLIAGANILLASVLLSLAYVRTGSLWLPIGIHLGWNGLQGPVLGINVTGMDLGFGHWRLFNFTGDPLMTGAAMGVEGGLAGLIGPAIGLGLVAFLVPQQPKPDFSKRTR
jgi:membrane protease YdiL (CAAX protease family)